MLLMAVLAFSAGAAWTAAGSVHARGKHRGDEGSASRPLSAAEAQQARALYARKCASCHGSRLEGGVGPSLAGVGSRYSAAKIARIAQNGKGKKNVISMPAGLATANEAHLLARWLVRRVNAP